MTDHPSPEPVQHPDYPEPQDLIAPCPVCEVLPDFSQMPRGQYRYVELDDGRAACQLHVPADPLIAPYVTIPVIAHVCANVPAKAVIAEAERIARRAAP